MKKFFIIIIGMIVLPGCAGKVFSSNSIFAPKPFKMGGPPKDAPPKYLAGWNDGCESGLSTMVQAYYKNFYAYKQDPVLSNNAMYYKAWKDAYTYCRHYSFRYTWDAFDKDRKFGNLCVICPNELSRSQ